MFRRTVKRTTQLLRTAALARRASSMYAAGYFNVLAHARRLSRERRFTPDEAFRLGLFDPRLPEAEIRRYLSRKELTKIQKSLNPQSWEPLLKNKAVFYRYCIALGIPVPELYAVFFTDAAGWCPDGSILSARSDWLKFIDTQLASHFVIKPSRGAFGKAVRVFSRSQDKFVDSCGAAYTSETLYEIMASDPDHDSFVIQQRLKNHPDILHLTDTEHLQTIRITTVIDRDSRCHIIQTHLKLVTGSVAVDTFDHGLTGNIQAMISPRDGTLEPAITMSTDGAGIRTVPLHPRTQIPFAGFRMPMWRRTCEMVNQAALKFLPVRTIGWDVALTPEAPVIVEANFWWDPPNHHRRSDRILEALRAAM